VKRCFIGGHACKDADSVGCLAGGMWVSLSKVPQPAGYREVGKGRIQSSAAVHAGEQHRAHQYDSGNAEEREIVIAARTYHVAEHHGTEQAAQVASRIHDSRRSASTAATQIQAMAQAAGNIRSITPKQRVDTATTGNQTESQGTGRNPTESDGIRTGRNQTESEGTGRVPHVRPSVRGPKTTGAAQRSLLLHRLASPAE
jgi:hypothetical protein